MHIYFTYNLTIHSDVELPLWPADGAHATRPDDIVMERRPARPLSRELPEKGYEFHVCPKGGELVSQYIGAIRVSPGTPVHMQAIPLPDASEKLLAHFLSGSALAMAIHYLGYLPLHGCAVQIDGRNAIFMGLSGMGKSSLCAALCANGARIITDDISPVGWIDGRAHVMPGYPQMKLNDDIVELLDIPRDELVVLHELHHKMGWRREQDRFDAPQPIDGLYFLGIGDRELRTLDGLDAFRLLQRHATPSQWGFEGGRDHFLACGRLVKEVPTRAFIRERDLAQLDSQAAFITAHL